MFLLNMSNVTVGAGTLYSSSFLGCVAKSLVFLEVFGREWTCGNAVACIMCIFKALNEGDGKLLHLYFSQI